jgi:hypothetical protein
MPIGVMLSELRHELRAEIYSSLLPAHAVSSIDMQNIILERTQRELWNQYEWPQLQYRITVPVTAGATSLPYPATMPFENVLSLWYQQNATSETVWIKLGYGFNDSINELLRSFPPVRWRNVATVDTNTGLTDLNGMAQIWPVPSQALNMRWLGQAPLNPLKVDTDTCMIDSTAIVLTAAAEFLGAQKAEVATLKGQKAQAYIRRLIGKMGANKREIHALGQGRGRQYGPVATPYLDYIPGP